MCVHITLIRLLCRDCQKSREVFEIIDRFPYEIFDNHKRHFMIEYLKKFNSFSLNSLFIHSRFARPPSFFLSGTRRTMFDEAFQYLQHLHMTHEKPHKVTSTSRNMQPKGKVNFQRCPTLTIY